MLLNRIAFALILTVLIAAPTLASKKYNRYLTHIFNKYGSNGVMSFEVFACLFFFFFIIQIFKCFCFVINALCEAMQTCPSFVKCNDSFVRFILTEDLTKKILSNDSEFEHKCDISYWYSLGGTSDTWRILSFR